MKWSRHSISNTYSEIIIRLITSKFFWLLKRSAVIFIIFQCFPSPFDLGTKLCCMKEAYNTMFWTMLPTDCFIDVKPCCIVNSIHNLIEFLGQTPEYYCFSYEYDIFLESKLVFCLAPGLYQTTRTFKFIVFLPNYKLSSKPGTSKLLFQFLVLVQTCKLIFCNHS